MRAGTRRTQPSCARVAGRAGLVAVILAAAPPAPAQEPAPPGSGSPPEARAEALTVHEVMTDSAEAIDVDVRARFEEFQRDLAEEFGGESGSEPRAKQGDELGARLGTAFAARWKGSAAYRWYERLEGVYGRVEGLYQRIETSTDWATKGFSVDPDLEAAVDGKLRLNVERSLGGFDMGLDVDDAMNGRVGLRLGGVIRGYKFSFDVSDVVGTGRAGFQIRKTTK